MPEYSRILGDVVKVARGKSGLTQAEVAVAIHRDTRTVLNIENYKGNPKLEVLYVRPSQRESHEPFHPIGIQGHAVCFRFFHLHYLR